MRQPEHAFDYRAACQVGTVGVEIMARHHVRRRMPRGRELTRQVASWRGGPRLIEEEAFSWLVFANGMPLGLLRQNIDGTYTLAREGMHRRSREKDLLGAIEEIVGALTKTRRQSEAATDDEDIDEERERLA